MTAKGTKFRFSMELFFKIIILAFFGCAAFFTYSVISFKRGLQTQPKEIVIQSGQKVTVEKIIDGDEISVKSPKGTFIVRILGVKAYDPTVNDHALQNIAKSAFNYLQNTILNTEVEVLFDTFQTDDKKRILAYINGNNGDVGLEMVKQGIVLVYNRYSFSRMPTYITAENESILDKLGIWGIEAAIQRSRQLKKLWDNQREKESRLKSEN
ncbi:MAG: thermonuclease family protein [bacterium]|nr:thermonuclease family protein [bacterium]